MAAKRNTKKPKRTGHIKTSGARRHRYGPAVAIIFLILIVVSAFVGYKVIKSFDDPILKKSENGSNTAGSPKTEDEKTNDNNSGSQDTKEDKTKEDNPPRETEKSNPKYEGNDVNSENTLTGIVNYVGLSDNTFMVRVAIDQTISSGTCDFALTSPSGKVYGFSNSTTSGPSSTYCGLDADFSSLRSEHGTWKISTTIKSTSGKTGIISGEGAI